MFTKIKSLLFLALIVGLAGACDISETGTQNSTKPEFTSTDDISDRITYINNSKSKAGPSGGATVQDIPDYEAVAQVTSPVVNGVTARASHLSFDQTSGLLTVGYKLRGDAYGGGVDIIELADNIDNTDNSDIIESLRGYSSPNYDVQEVRFSPDENSVFVAGAVSEKKADMSPSRIVRLSLDNNGQIDAQTSEILSGKVSKSLVLGEQSNSDKLFVISDENTLYRFDEELGAAEATLTANAGVEFRSVQVRGNNGVFVLDRNGIVRSANPGNLGSFTGTTDVIPGSNSGIDNELSISRLQYFDRQNSDDLFVASLNELGFSILDPTGSQLWNSQESQNSEFYVSVAYLESPTSGSTDFLLAAREDGIIDFFEIPDGWNLQTNLNKAGSIDLSQVEDFNLSGAQVNQILATENYLYVANSSDGTVILRLNKSKDGGDGNGDEAPDAPNGAKAISFAAFCTTQEDYDTDDITITDIKEKEEDEPVSIAWESDTELSTVVLKAGPNMWNYDGGTSGGAASGAGTSVGNDQSAPSPCPNGEELIVKKEVDDNGEFKNEEDDNDDDDDHNGGGGPWWWGN